MTTKSMIDKKLNIRFENGTTASGKTAIKTTNLSNVKLDATDDDMMAAGAAYASLTSLTLDGVRMTDVYDLATDGE